MSGAVAWLLCTTCAVSFPAPASADPLEPLLRALLLGPLLVGVLAAPSLRTLATPTAAAVPPLPPLLLVARQRERQRAVCMLTLPRWTLTLPRWMLTLPR